MNTIQTLYKCFYVEILHCSWNVFTLHIKTSFNTKICICWNFIDILFFFLIKNCNCMQYFLAYIWLYAVKWYGIYIIQNQKLKKWKRQWKKNSERTKKRLKTWRKHGRRDCQSKKQQIRCRYFPFPMYFFISHFLYTSLRFISSYHSFFLMNNKTSGYRVMLMQNAKSRKRKRLFPTFGICMKTLP